MLPIFFDDTSQTLMAFAFKGDAVSFEAPCVLEFSCVPHERGKLIILQKKFD